MAQTVTLETKCWENDWEHVLKTSWLNTLKEYNKYPFTKFTLIINNVSDRNEVEYYANQKVEEGILTDYHVVADYEKSTLKYFDISLEEKSYPYSISELVSIFLCGTDYLLHFSSDSTLEQPYHNWITESIEEMEGNDKVKLINPVWNHKLWEAKEESFLETDNFLYSKDAPLCSDQCFFIKTETFRQRIYSELNNTSTKIYSLGVGNLFERRVDAWMRNNNHWRAVHKNVNYIHKNWGNSSH